MTISKKTKHYITIFFYFITYNTNSLPDCLTNLQRITVSTQHAKRQVHTIQDTIQNYKKSFIIKKIIIKGNKKTKNIIIIRELNFNVGDTLREKSPDQIMEINRNNIFNTGLFVTVELNAERIVQNTKHIDDKHKTEDDGRSENNELINVIIIVKERWYTFPVPVFELADRNFNVWWYEQNKTLNRIEYGIRFYQENCWGRNERLKIVLQSGYTKKYELYYNVPYIDKKQILGIRPSISYSRNREIAYKTYSNKLIFYRDPEFIIKKFNTGLKFFIRKAIHTIHSLDIKYYYNTIADTIIRLNPDYFNNNNDQKYLQISYAYKRDFRDIQYYPLTGSYFNLEVKKSGTGIFNDINQLELTANYTKFWDVGKKFYLASMIKSKNSIPKMQPFLNSRAFGYNQNFVRGYEYYVIDGQHFLLGKVTFKKLLYSTTKEFKTFIPVSQFQTIPFAVYLKIYSDAGYVVNNNFTKANNSLTNTFLSGGGIGLDIITSYDTVFRIEYSVNDRKEKGFYLHFEADI